VLLILNDFCAGRRQLLEQQQLHPSLAGTDSSDATPPIPIPVWFILNDFCADRCQLQEQQLLRPSLAGTDRSVATSPIPSVFN
jgi:hypothetical protein